MYRRLIRPVLFLLSAETVHGLVSLFLRRLFMLPGISRLFSNMYNYKHPKLERELFGLRFPNPVGIAAGFDKEARLYNILGSFGFGHVEVGTVTPLGQPGNPRPRLFRLADDDALINRMGFNNHGVKAIVENLKKNKPNIIIGGNIGKNTLTPHNRAIADYCICFKELFDYVDYFVINVSCPNIEGLSKLQDKDELMDLLGAVQKINHAKDQPRPVLLKISPDLTDQQLEEVIEIVEANKLSGIVASNTSTRRDGLKSSISLVQSIGKGGLSGKPLQHKTLRTVSYLHKNTAGRIPIIAVGGIFNVDDALMMLRAGASLVQVYTGFVYEGPAIAKRINKKLAAAGSQS